MEQEIQITNNGKFITLQCVKGHKITSWNEGDSIEDFNDFTIAYVGLNADTTKFHCITDDESARLHKELEEFLDEKHRKEEEEMNKEQN